MVTVGCSAMLLLVMLVAYFSSTLAAGGTSIFTFPHVLRSSSGMHSTVSRPLGPLVSTITAVKQHAPGWPRSQPLTIAHRGASGYLPEHTREAYLLAIEMGADVIECDVVLTRDLVGICRHEPNLDTTTNARTLFPDKVNTYDIDGHNVTGVFACDLTMTEVRQLHAVQPWPFRDQKFNNQFAVVTLEEYLDIALAAPRIVGVYPETKHPTWHNSLPWVVAASTSIEATLLAALHSKGYQGSINTPAWLKQPAYIQSFEASSLRRMASQTCLPMVQLLGEHDSEVLPDGQVTADLLTDTGLAQLASYAAVIAPGKPLLVSWADGPAGGSYQSAGLVERARHHGLQVHLYTLRSEQRFILPHLNSSAAEMDVLLNAAGVDGAFTDFSDVLLQFLSSQDGASWHDAAWNTPGMCAVSMP